jgi:hypothetical protein
MHHPRLHTSAAIALVLWLAACAAPSQATPSAPGPGSAEPTPTATPAGDLETPVGVVAFGHSNLTGEGTAGLQEPALGNSWATGDNPEVNSVYLRLTGVRPETEGHVANTAMGGAPSFQLMQQAEAALRRVPYPALAIIATIDSDIRCDGTDDEHLPEFGENVAEVLDFITSQSPNTRILVVGQPGRPSVDFVEELVAHDPSAKAGLTEPGNPCTFFDADGAIFPEGLETLTGIIEAYEAEQARVCAEYPNCATDGGVRAAYQDTLENFSPDWAHLNIKGQAAEAELIWPVVEELLEL